MKYRLRAASSILLNTRYDVVPPVTFSQLGKRFNSKSTTEGKDHSPDTYRKEESTSAPKSSKTFVVDGDEKTQRPFDLPSGSYATKDSDQPYDEPIPKSENNHKKPRYGNLNRGSGGGTAPDVDPTGNPLDQGREGRR